MAGCLLRWKATQALAAAVLGLYWAALGAVCFVTLLNPLFILLYYGLFTVPAFVIVGCCTVFAHRVMKRAWWARSVAAGFSCGFITVFALFVTAR
jgi:hypothetical protein